MSNSSKVPHNKPRTKKDREERKPSTKHDPSRCPHGRPLSSYCSECFDMDDDMASDFEYLYE